MFVSGSCIGALMNKILGLLVLLLSIAVHAEWRLIHTDADQSQFFIDPTNVSLIDGYQRAWVLNNLAKANPQGTRSFRSVEEFDCNAKSARVMQISAFAGEMASGDLLARRHGNGQWVKPETGTVDHMLLEAACQTKP